MSLSAALSSLPLCSSSCFSVLSILVARVLAIRSLAHLLKNYLGIADNKIYFPQYIRSHLAYDSNIWQSRPPPTHLVLGAARNTLYLLALYKVVRATTLLSRELCPVPRLY